VIVLDIPRATPSLNATRYKHWRVAQREKELWHQEVRVARMQGGYHGVKPPQKARVTIERYGPRTLDVDNFIAGLKGLLDALRRENLIRDDTADCLELVPRQFRGSPRTVVTVEAA
jgi:Holliday junction resolvase RusA-like endonuclease